LTQSLAQLRDGERWLEYLSPHRVIDLIKSNSFDALAELSRRYDGVLNNPALSRLANLDGFAATRSLLLRFADRPFVDEPIPSPPATDDSGDGESEGGNVEKLPIPAPLTSFKDAV
jgi:hypothetical protein